MTNLTVIILTGKEELHIGRCLEKLAPLEPRQIIVVESQKGDRTHEIALAPNPPREPIKRRARARGQAASTRKPPTVSSITGAPARPNRAPAPTP